MKLKYFSHSAFQLTTNDEKIILIDPFLDNNPTSPVKSVDVKPDYIILTHGHGDHVGDSLKIAKRVNPLFICCNELANYIIKKGFNAHNMNIGGSYNFEFGKVKFTIAHHSSMTYDEYYAGEAAGVIITSGGISVYHTGDTSLFYDMKLIGEMTPIDYMLLPIGDNFTMGIDDAIKAVELTNPRTAIPIHYNTFPEISADPQEFKSRLSRIGMECRIMEFGEEIQL